MRQFCSLLDSRHETLHNGFHRLLFDYLTNLLFKIAFMSPHATPIPVHSPLQSDTLATSPSDYMMQLDALRAFAVGAVMFFHFYGKGAQRWMLLGDWGVQLFFVLSGFLITGILLRSRDLADQQGGRKFQIRQFYIRRSLRIFPLFYLAIVAAALLDIPPVRQTLLWHLTYTSNFYFALRGDWNGAISHLWSLAVEEQFYLVCPFLILYLPRKSLLFCIVAAIIIAPVYRICGVLLGLNSLAQAVMMVGCLDSLGMGALLAWFRHTHPKGFQEAGRSRASTAWGIGLFVALMLSLRLPVDQDLRKTVIAFTSSAFFAWLIGKAAVGIQGTTGKLLEAKPLRYLGKISYGLYVYHNFMPWVVGDILRWLHLPPPSQPALQFCLYVGVTLVVASSSWFGFERPINNLKHRFEYTHKD